MTALPARATLDGSGTPTTSAMKTALGALHDFLAETIGATGGAPTAVASMNGGPLAGMRNRVINGSGIIQQRTAPTLTAALQYGTADRHLVGVTGATGLGGTVGILANTGFTAGVGYGAIAASWTTGAFIHKHRIEGANTKDLNSKTVTVSGKLYQDTGGSRSFTVSIGRPTTTLDTFSAVTNIGTSSAIPVATGTVTAFSFTQALGATDGDKGLEILITDNATNTVVTKNYLVGDLQLEIGSVATTFEQRPIGLELALCQRYYYRKVVASSYAFAMAMAQNTTQGFGLVQFPVSMRVAPTSLEQSGTVADYRIRYGVSASNCSSAPSFTAATPDSCSVIFTLGSAVLTAGWGIVLESNASAAYLGFAGAEL